MQRAYPAIRLVLYAGIVSNCLTISENITSRGSIAETKTALALEMTG